MKYHLYFPLEQLSARRSLSERALAEAARVSRMSVREIKKGENNLRLESITRVADFFDLQVEVLTSPLLGRSELSTVATAYHVERDGFASWKIHYMNLVDELRRTLDIRLILLPPHQHFDSKLKALMASLVNHLCHELEIPAPRWSTRRYFLECPWFPAEAESLKASALLESPIAFRSNNIFVHENFTARA